VGPGKGIFRYHPARVTIWPDPRAPAPGEWPSLRDAINRIFRPAGGDLTAELPRLFHPANRGNLRVVVGGAGAGAVGLRAPDEDEAHILAHAAYLPRLAIVGGQPLRVGCIGAVFVVPGMRGQGIGTHVLESVLALARAESELVLVSGDRGLYRRQGLRPASPLVRFVPSPDSRAAARIRTRDATADDIDRLIAMHDALDVRFVRSAGDWRHWLAGGLSMMGAPARCALVMRGGDPVGYAVTLTSAAGGRRIIELGGDREAVLDAAGALGDELWVPPYDADTLARARARGWTGTPRAFPMTAEARSARATTVPWYGLDYL
jgi:predicted N-acetyltransferase YhbS